MPHPLFSLTDLSALAAEISTYRKHFTASAVVLEQSHILLVHHRRIGAWLPPGGHIEENELPHQTAMRETKEETGIDVDIISNDLPATKNEDAFFLPSPLCMHTVRACEKNSVYYHIDLAYLCRTAVLSKDKGSNLPEIISNEEVHEARWIALHNLNEIPLANNVMEIVSLAQSRLKLRHSLADS